MGAGAITHHHIQGMKRSREQAAHLWSVLGSPRRSLLLNLLRHRQLSGVGGGLYAVVALVRGGGDHRPGAIAAVLTGSARLSLLLTPGHLRWRRVFIA